MELGSTIRAPGFQWQMQVCRDSPTRNVIILVVTVSLGGSRGSSNMELLLQGAGEPRNFYHVNLGEMIQFDYIFFKMDLIDTYWHHQLWLYVGLFVLQGWKRVRYFYFEDGFLLSLGKSPEHEQQNLEKLWAELVNITLATGSSYFCCYFSHTSSGCSFLRCFYNLVEWTPGCLGPRNRSPFSAPSRGHTRLQFVPSEYFCFQQNLL